MVSSGVSTLDHLLGDGYPDNSAILVVGPTGIGKEALAYWFTHSGLAHGDLSLYITRLTVNEVLSDVKGFGIDLTKQPPVWLDGITRTPRADSNDLENLTANIKNEIAKTGGKQQVRIAIDVLSSLLMYNPLDDVYKFLNQLLSELKKYDAVLLSTLDEGMHPPQVVAAMQQLFDGVVELKMYEEGLRAVPLLRIRKMRGTASFPGYFDFSFTKTGMVISPHTVKELGIRGWLRGPRSETR